jgi:membrane protease YdiL (CAAX protease family)
MTGRMLAAAEVVVIVGGILAIIWVVQPLHGPGPARQAAAVLAVLLVASSCRHHDSLAQMGVRLDTFPRAVARLIPMSVGAAAVALAAGYLLETIDPPEHPVMTLGVYYLWAVAQQYALNACVLRRLEDAGLRRAAPLVAAALFSIVHAPNPGLMILTFVGGLLWCSTFQKQPNLFATALSHAVLAVLIVSTLPPAATGGLRIGPAYSAARP